jgi:ABC-2 type transport system permease protein
MSTSMTSRMTTPATIAVETAVVFTRQMRLLIRNPVWVFFGLTQPILYLALFGPLLTKIRQGGLGGSSSWSVFVPGILLQLTIFGAGFAGFGIIQELREGVIDRQRVTPASRLSLLLGRTLSNVVTIGIQAVLLVIVAIPFGLRPHWVGVLITLILICVLALGISAASYSMGIILKDEDSFAPFIQGVSLPLLLLSGVLLPMTLAPRWLRDVSKVNPLSYLVDASRSLFVGHFSATNVMTGILVTIALTLLLAWWGTRTFSKSSA